MPVLETKGAISAQGYGLTVGAAAVPNYIEDVFSTWLYTGNGSTQTITNGIDLAGKGGLVWIKARNTATRNILFDTDRGVNNYLFSDGTNAQATDTSLTSFLSNGFSLSQASGLAVNANSNTYASWTFREQPKFFDVVTYTGNGANRTIAHSLGSVPGCIMVKRTDTSADWQVYHRSNANTQYMVLNSTAAVATGATRWNSTTPTDTVFSLGTDATVNASGGTYVAYLFAHNAGGFGLTGTDNVISCGAYTGNGSATGPVVTLGYEPQWVLIRRALGGNGDWCLIDSMRGFVVGGADAVLNPNLSNAESSIDYVRPTATGFQINSTSLEVNTSGSTYIYIAIRRGPMKVPTTGTSVFTPRTGSDNSLINTTHLVDTFIDGVRNVDNAYNFSMCSRLTGRGGLVTSNTNAELIDWTGPKPFEYNRAYFPQIFASGAGVQYAFSRAPGFFDVVCYTQTVSGSPYQTQSFTHNLGVIPELVITKGRSTAFMNWIASAYVELGANQVLTLISTNAQSASGTSGGIATPTSTTASGPADGGPGDTYVAYLFASCPGVSKVGSFTGTGATQVINCGFTGGARFVLIKSKSAAGDWYVWDSARGIVPLNDPYLRLNSTAAEVTNTDWVDTAATGFELSNAGGNLANSNGVSYIFLAIS